MKLPAAYAGRILRVDLGTGRSEHLDTASYAERFVGGRGLATALYYEATPPEARFDDERCRVVMAVGPLAGTPSGLGGSRWGIFGKSPYPRAEHGRDHFCYGSLGGRLGAELRYAGYDALVLDGKAEGPVSLHIADDHVQLRDASTLWGMGTVETRTRLTEAAGARAKALAIGPAGERLVPLATVFADGDASCSGGMGAALGAKRLKGLTVQGSARRVEVADREALRRIDREIRDAQRGNVRVWGLDFMAHGPRTSKYPCHGCMGHCLRVRYRSESGASGKFMCQSRFFYMAHAWGHYGAETDVPFLANRLCDDAGLDTWEVQALLEWLLLGHAQGLFSPEETGLDLERVGSLELIEELVTRISRREGFGDVLADGARAAARAWGGAAEALFARTDPYDPRYCPVNTLLFPFESREPIQQLHEAGLLLAQWSSWAKGVPEAHVSSEVLMGIAKRFWGNVQAADMTTLHGKAEAARRIQERQLAKECLGLCDWMFPLMDRPRGPDHVGEPGFESRILEAVLGVPCSEADLHRVGERVFNLQRAILLREGHRAREDDVLPPEWHDAPIQTHVADPDLLVPGPGGEVRSALGRRVDRRAFERLRDEYYERRGWDVPTGLPSRPLLLALDLPEVAQDLGSRGLLAQKARPRSPAQKAVHRFDALSERLLALSTRGIGRVLSRLGMQTGPGSAPGKVRIQGEALRVILCREQGKFGDPSIRENFRGWTKTMEYAFPDIDERWVIRFVDGVAQTPERVEGLSEPAQIRYTLQTWVLREMSEGRLSGEQAYLRRLLRVQAPFTDLMKLQALNKVGRPPSAALPPKVE